MDKNVVKLLKQKNVKWRKVPLDTVLSPLPLCLSISSLVLLCLSISSLPLSLLSSPLLFLKWVINAIEIPTMGVYKQSLFPSSHRWVTKVQAQKQLISHFHTISSSFSFLLGFWICAFFFLGFAYSLILSYLPFVLGSQILMYSNIVEALCLFSWRSSAITKRCCLKSKQRK